MPLPKNINELPVFARDHPNVSALPSAGRARQLSHKGFSTMIRGVISVRGIGLEPIDDIWQQINETDAALDHLSEASIGVEGADHQLAVPEHNWCLIQLGPYETYPDHLEHLLPSGFFLGAEVEIIKGEPVCYKNSHGQMDHQYSTDEHVLTSNRIKDAYIKQSTGAKAPILDDVHPYQSMKSKLDDCSTQLTFVDIDLVLAPPPK